MTVRIKIDGKTLRSVITWDDIELIESRDALHSKAMIAKFVVDENGNPIPSKAALKQLGGLSLNEIGGIVDEFYKLFNESIANPTTGTPSPSPSSTTSPEESQSGISN